MGNPRAPSIFKPDSNTNGVTPQDIINNAIENRHIGSNEINLDKLSNEVLVQLEKVSNTITVATDGGNYELLSDAMDSITDASIINPYIIKLSPGVYTEPNPITCKSFVYIRGEGIVIIKPQTVSQSVFILEQSSFIDNVTIQGATSGVGIYKNTTGNSTLSNITFIDCEKCICIENTLGILNARNLTVLIVSSNSTNAFEILAGNITITNTTLFIIPTFTCTNLFYIESSNSIVTIDSVISFSAGLGNGFLFKSGPNCVIRNVSLVGMNVGFFIQGAVSVRLFSSVVFNAQSYSVHVDSTAGVSLIGIYGCEFKDATVLDVLVECTTCTIFGSSITVDSSKIQVLPGVSLNMSFTDIFEGDEGFGILGELHVGSQIDPTESVFGEGDSHTNMLVFTETDGGVFANITTEAKSFSGSTFTFTGIGVNSAIYICDVLNDGVSNLKHHGIKYECMVAGVMGGGEIIIEYWNGSAWIEFNGTVTDGSEPFLPYAKQYFEATGKFQLKYNPLMVNNSWVANDPITPSIGTNYFWIRFRIKTGITTAPIFQQFKVHTSRSEKNSEGYDEFFGNARPWIQLPVSIGNAKPVEGAMQNQTIYLDQNLGVGYQVNKFTATTDILGWGFTIPNNIDTSAPILVRWTGLFNTSHTPEWTIRWAKSLPDGNIYTSEPGAASNPSTQSTTVSKAIILDQQTWFEVYLDVSTFIARRNADFPDFMMITIQPTTLTGTFSIMDIQIYYLIWGIGGHVD